MPTNDYIPQRRNSYRKNGLDVQEINDLLMEYNLAVAAGDTTTANKYKTQLQEIHQKRQEIKQQFPKD